MLSKGHIRLPANHLHRLDTRRALVNIQPDHALHKFNDLTSFLSKQDGVRPDQRFANRPPSRHPLDAGQGLLWNLPALQHALNFIRSIRAVGFPVA